MCRLFLNKKFQMLWEGKDPLVEAFAITGEDFREVKARRTTRFEYDGKGYFIKLHSGIGWKEYFKDIFQLKKPVTGAGQEFDALIHLHKTGVPTMTEAAFGCRGWLKAYEKSFLVTEELCHVKSLEDLAKNNEGKISFPLREKIIKALAESAGKMHRAGLNHRDCYICHFLLDEKLLAEEDKVVLYVIDLHRAQIRKKVPLHFLVKDLAGLYFSAMTYMFPDKKDVCRFLKSYFVSSSSLRQIFSEHGPLLKKVQKAAEKLYEKENGRKMPQIF
ncbi:MAG: lipopolysaccharide core heptose(I) kinase RfaP [Lentisphaeria bacterium]|nr:lipopolysaccharide core heptose(I) kinase RfaP [Lentisphaeria bacterium]